MPLALPSETEALHTVIITIPDDLSAQLAPYHDHLDILLRVGLREVKMQQSLALFQKGTLSLWKAVWLAGVSLREMIQYAVSQGVRAPLGSVSGVDEATLQEELAAALPEATMLPEAAASSEA